MSRIPPNPLAVIAAPGRAPPEETRTRILACSVALFARAGFEGVSMRDVATAVGVTPAALYYHFPDKEQLYLAAVGYIFNDRLRMVLDGLAVDGDPWAQLEGFIGRFVRLVATERDFQRLMQWVLLDTDAARSQQLADNVFEPFFVAIAALTGNVGKGYDTHLLTISVFGMILFPFESAAVARFMPGFRSPHQDVDVLAKHIVALLRNGLPGDAR